MPTPHNESAITYQWLLREFQVTNPDLLVDKRWTAIRDEMRNVSTGFSSIQDWISDFWLSMGFSAMLGMMLLANL